MPSITHFLSLLLTHSFKLVASLMMLFSFATNAEVTATPIEPLAASPSTVDVIIDTSMGKLKLS